MVITEANQSDFDEIWNIFSAVVKTGTTYVYSPNTTKDQSFDIWITRPKKTFVLRDSDGVMKGTYYIKENRPDLGSHICRCGFMVLPNSRREGVGAAMCKHSLVESKKLGFRGMQLSYVVESNKASVNLWLKMGFAKVGQIPNAFQHQELGDVDVLIMYKSLTD